ncbi:MAG TPA: SCP2 sterol-binding domain-containing protein [Polyangiaceae bacterium]|jgi:putative sterol carrier protein|nr:SCP2 sterol-binding domain-containing protein [Polyangiaceae bacterium]
MPDFTATSPEELRALIAGRSDDEINAGLRTSGVGPALDKVFEGMVAAFLPEKAGGTSAVIQYDVNGIDGKHSYQLKVADGKCQFQKGSPDSARVTLTLSAPDFLRLVTGKLNGQTAFFQGKLKLSGDMMFAQTMQSWFKMV